MNIGKLREKIKFLDDDTKVYTGGYEEIYDVLLAETRFVKDKKILLDDSEELISEEIALVLW